ncbi:MAG: hypothetical protein IKQ45_04785 [Clostridia bacterium]|nr:hypothetical protein [Clostridia bacterium]
MGKVYISSLETPFAEKLAALFEKDGYKICTVPEPGIEYFIDVTDEEVPGDDRKAGEGIDADAAAEAYRKNVCEPLARLSEALPGMVGRKRICFLNSVKSSINLSTETSGYGHNMSRAALNLILVLSKNGLAEKGYTFRLFDPLAGTVPPGLAAHSAMGYFTRDRFADDEWDGLGRNDELNLVVRDALGRELPW